MSRFFWWMGVASAFAAIAIGCSREGDAPPAANASNATAAPADEAPFTPMLDLTGDFLANACPAEPGFPFATAWLEHENRHRDFYIYVFYHGAEARETRVALAEAHGPLRDAACDAVRTFRASAPKVLAHVRPRVAALTGAAPRTPVAFAVAVSKVRAKLGMYRGASVLAFNAESPAFAGPNELGYAATRAFVRDVQDATFGGHIELLPALVSALYRDGAAAFAATRIFPSASFAGEGDATTGMDDAEIARAKPQLRDAARDILAAIRAHDDARAKAQFFPDEAHDDASNTTAFAGPLVALAVFHEIAKHRGPEDAVRISPKDFAREVQAALEAVATSKVESAHVRR